MEKQPFHPKWTYFNMATDTTHFIDYHELGPCNIIGHSRDEKMQTIEALTQPELV
jgi:hypothetical protein